MNLRSTVNHLENCLMQEIQAQNEALYWVGNMEEAIAEHNSKEFEALAKKGTHVCRSADKMGRTRMGHVATLAKAWDVPAGTLTLGSVVRRLGNESGRLNELRLELRKVVGSLMKRQRRLAALIGMHTRINADVMQLILGCDSHAEVNQGGSLVNAEA